MIAQRPAALMALAAARRHNIGVRVATAAAANAGGSNSSSNSSSGAQAAGPNSSSPVAPALRSVRRRPPPPPAAAAAAPQLHPRPDGAPDGALASAEDLLQRQLRALPAVSAEALAAIAASGSGSSDQQQQPKQQQQALAGADHGPQASSTPPPPPPPPPEPQQARGALAALLSRLPRVDGRLRGLLLLNLMTLLMGSNWVVVKASADAATMSDCTVFMAMRFALAAALFLPFLKPDRRVLQAGLEIGVFYAGGYVCQALALAHTAASRASLLSTFTVLIVPMIAGLNGQRVRPVVWACAAAALAGTAMLVRPLLFFSFVGKAPKYSTRLLACCDLQGRWVSSPPIRILTPPPFPPLPSTRDAPHNTQNRRRAAASARRTSATPGPCSRRSPSARRCLSPSATCTASPRTASCP